MTASEKKDLSQSQTVTSGSSLRLEEPKSNRRRKRRVAAIASAGNPAVGFVGFLRENAVVGLAVGFVIGAQVQVVVKQLIASFIDPLSQLLFGQALSQRSFVLHYNGRTVAFSWGTFVYILINFLFVLLVIYLIIKILKLDKLDKPKEDK